MGKRIISGGFFRRARRDLAYWMVLWITLASLTPAFARQSPPPQRWPPLTEVLAKWDAAPPEAVIDAAGKGELTAEYYLGYSYTEGHRFAIDTPQGISWYERAGNDGYTPAIHRLGQIYQRGKGVPRDYAKALEYYQTAAKKGYAQSQFDFGYLAQNNFDTDKAGTNSDERFSALAEAVMWYTLSADEHFPPAEYYLGRCYVNGMGVPRDEEKGLELLRRSADHGHGQAIIDLAKAYAAGIGEPRTADDTPDALLLRATTGTDSKLVGWAYDTLIARRRSGLGGGVNLVLAAELYCRAVSAGVPGYYISEKVEPGQPVRHMELTGDATDGPLIARARITGGWANRGFDNVLSLYLKSAKGDGAARLKIGDAYLAGRNVPKSALRAWAWYSLAGGAGEQKLAAAGSVLTAAEQAEAGKLAEKIKSDLEPVARALDRGM